MAYDILIDRSGSRVALLEGTEKGRRHLEADLGFSPDLYLVDPDTARRVLEKARAVSVSIGERNLLGGV